MNREHRHDLRLMPTAQHMAGEFVPLVDPNGETATSTGTVPATTFVNEVQPARLLEPSILKV